MATSELRLKDGNGFTVTVTAEVLIQPEALTPVTI
jgi:hypothetical protein